MKLSAANWVFGASPNPDIESVMAARVATARRELESALKKLRAAPASVRARGYAKGIRYVLQAPARERVSLLEHPAMDHWLALWKTHFSSGAPTRDWHTHLGVFQSFAATAAVRGGQTVSFDVVLEPDGGLYLYGSPYCWRISGSLALKHAKLHIGPRGARVEAPGRRWELPLEPKAGALPGSMIVQDRGFLLTRGVTIHGLARLDERRRCEFELSIVRAMNRLRRQQSELHDEILRTVRWIIPLEPSEKFKSVSSSYAHLRGAICLSHSADSMLQAETLIHEYCHQKLNLLALVEPILLPGQNGQVFYSPWRPDARRLRGLLLGAHAFLNVARFLDGALGESPAPIKENDELIHSFSQRLFQINAALRCLSSYASCTPFGRRFMAAMSAEQGRLVRRSSRFPERFVRDARQQADRHYRLHAVAGTFIHR